MKRMKEIERTFNINLSKPEYIKSDLSTQMRDKNPRATMTDPFANDSKPFAQISPTMNSKQTGQKLSGQRSVAIKSGQMQVFANSGIGTSINRLNSQAPAEPKAGLEDLDDFKKVTMYNNSIERPGLRGFAANMDEKSPPMETRNG